MVKLKRSVCPHDCPDTCGLLVGVENNRVVSVKGDPEHPFTQGAVCVKVRHYPERIYSPLRIHRPLKRTGPKGSGRFVPISWDEALEEIVERYERIISVHGPEAILPYSYGGTLGLLGYHAGHAFFHKLGASKLDRNICSSTHRAGFAASLGSGPPSDIERAVDSDLIIIWGGNTLVSNMHAWPFFLEARRRRARIVVIDPYRNATTRLADRHLRLKPGTDAALALGLMNVIIKEDLVDRDFMGEYTIGFERLAERAAQYPPSRVEEITGVPAEEIERLARDYGRAGAPFIRLGWGPGRQFKGGMAVRAIALLPGLTGAIHKKGGGIIRSTSPAFELNRAVVEREDLAPPGGRTIRMSQLGWALTLLANPPVMALHVYQSNPAVIAPDSSQVLAGLRREDLFVVVQELVMTETALWADLVLPSTTCFESIDLYESYGHYYLQMARPVIEPVGQARPPLAIFQDLARRFGFKEDCFTATEEDLIRGLIETDSPYLAGITFDRLDEGRPVRLNVPENPFSDGFRTPSGRIEFYSQALADQGLDPLPDGTPSLDEEGEGRYPLQLTTPPRREFLNSTFGEIDYLRNRAGRPTIMIHPRDAAARGLDHGQLVRVFNDRGDCYLYAAISKDTAPGVTVVEGLPWPRYMPRGRGVNWLTSQRLTDLGGGCAFHGNLVEIERAG